MFLQSHHHRVWVLASKSYICANRFTHQLRKQSQKRTSHVLLYLQFSRNWISFPNDKHQQYTLLQVNLKQGMLQEDVGL